MAETNDSNDSRLISQSNDDNNNNTNNHFFNYGIWDSIIRSLAMMILSISIFTAIAGYIQTLSKFDSTITWNILSTIQIFVFVVLIILVCISKCIIIRKQAEFLEKSNKKKYPLLIFVWILGILSILYLLLVTLKTFKSNLKCLQITDKILPISLILVILCILLISNDFLKLSTCVITKPITHYTFKATATLILIFCVHFLIFHTVSYFEYFHITQFIHPSRINETCSIFKETSLNPNFIDNSFGHLVWILQISPGLFATFVLIILHDTILDLHMVKEQLFNNLPIDENKYQILNKIPKICAILISFIISIVLLIDAYFFITLYRSHPKALNKYIVIIPLLVTILNVVSLLWLIINILPRYYRQNNERYISNIYCNLNMFFLLGELGFYLKSVIKLFEIVFNSKKDRKSFYIILIVHYALKWIQAFGQSVANDYMIHNKMDEPVGPISKFKQQLLMFVIFGMIGYEVSFIIANYCAFIFINFQMVDPTYSIMYFTMTAMDSTTTACSLFFKLFSIVIMFSFVKPIFL